jgi:hypothetical protein
MIKGQAQDFRQDAAMAQQIDLLEGIYRIALDNFAEG